MRYNVFSYLIGEGFRNLFKNKKSTVASLGIMCCTMLIFGVFFAIGENINHVVREIESAQGMQVFIQNEATQEEVDRIGLEINALNGVNTVTYVSKQQALDQMKENLKENKDLLSGYEGDNNIFPASYIVTLTDLSLSKEVQQEILELDNIKRITSRDETINALISLANGIRIVTGIILVLLVAISIFIISNTIKLTVHARRKEISIMKYVGATNSFIRWPFIVEGIIIGLFSAVITILLLGLSYQLIANQIVQSDFTNKVNITLLHFNDMLTLISTVYVILGMGIGIIGSSISMKKYLEV